MSKDVLLASSMGTGKSFAVTDIIADLINKESINVLLSVHSVKLALEYKEKLIKDHNIKPFILASHASTFGHQGDKETSLTTIDCPQYEEIQRQVKLGVSSSEYKREFCNTCKYFNTCPYPSQYKEVMEDEHKIIIIQHAHLSSQEVIYKLLNKGFKTLFIDETFIRNLFHFYKLDFKEIELLGKIDLEPSQKLFKWLNCDEKAIGVLSPSLEDLESLENSFKAEGLSYRVPDLIRFYNQHKIVNSLTGIEVVYELPQTPVRVFTDATPPVELLKLLTGIEEIEVYGDREVVDIKAINQDNKRYQIFDINNSKNRLSNEEYFQVLINKVCEIIRDRYINKKVLITLYKSEEQRVIDYINLNYSELIPFITYGLMNKGTNKWAYFDCQFIIAGRYRIGASYLQEAYELKTVANYHRYRQNKALFSNIYPLGLTSNSQIEIDYVPVEVLTQYNNELKWSRYQEIKYYRPKYSEDPRSNNFWNYNIFQLDVADMEQTERIRWYESTAKEVFHFHQYPMSHLVITDPLTFNQWLKV